MSSYKLTKVSDTNEGERFVILHVDPDKSERKGYIASDFTGDLTEEQVYEALRPFMADGEILELLKAARAEFQADTKPANSN